MLLILPTAEQSPDKTTSSLDAIKTLTGNIRRALYNARSDFVYSLGSWQIPRRIAALIILALSLSAGEAFPGGDFACGLEETALADLTRCEAVDTIL